MKSRVIAGALAFAGALAMVLTAIPGAALAQYLPAPDPVPDGIAASERQPLDAQYELLLELWANLDPSISEHEGRCTSVDTRDSALMAACAESEALLSASIDDYFGTMAEYESQLAAAKAAALAQAEAERRRIEEARSAEAHIDVPSRRQNPLEEWVWANWSKAPNYITIDPNLLRDPIRLREWMHNPAVADKIRRWYTDATQESAWQKLKNGSYFGTGTGADSAQWYADQYAATGSWYYGAGGLFSSLWMPDTYLDTALTLGPVVVGAAARYLSLGARGALGTRAVTGAPRAAVEVERLSGPFPEIYFGWKPPQLPPNYLPRTPYIEVGHRMWWWPEARTVGRSVTRNPPGWSEFVLTGK